MTWLKHIYSPQLVHTQTCNCHLYVSLAEVMFTSLLQLPWLHLSKDCSAHLLLIEFSEELDVVVLEEDLCLAERPAVHLEAHEQQAAVVAGREHALVVAKRKEAVPGGEGGGAL